MTVPEWDTDLFVGRDRERAVLISALDRLVDGAAQVVEVTGEPGIGKTRLLDYLAQIAAERGLLTLTGTALESSRNASFALLTDVLCNRLVDVDLSRVMGADSLHLGALARILPSLSMYGNYTTGAATWAEHYRVRLAVRTLLERLASPCLVLILDDLHWADNESADLVAHLLRQPPRAPVLLALAYRERQASEWLRAEAAALSRRAERLELGPLSEPESIVLLGRRGTSFWRKAVYEQSGGNPFYLEALARSLPDRHVSGALRVDELPPSVTAVLLAELSTLSATAQLVARAAAVANEPFDAGLVASIAGLDEANVLLAIDELASRDLVRAAYSARCIRFRHPLVRRVVYENSPPGWRLSAHAKAADALTGRGASAIARAHHVCEVARPGDRAAVALLAQAAQEIRLCAPASAARWLREALRLLPDEDKGPGRTTLLLHLAGVLGAAGQLQECRDTLHDALGLLPGGPVTQRAQAVALCALMERHLGRRDGGRALLLRELSRMADPEAAAAAWLKFELASSELANGNPAASRMWAGQSLATAGQHGANALRAAILALMAIAQLFCAEPPAATSCLNEAASLLDGLLDCELAECLDAAAWVGWGEIFLERQADAMRHLDRGLALANATGHDLLISPLLVGRALVLCMTGRLDDASACGQDALEMALITGSSEQGVSAMAARCWILTWLGETDASLHAGAFAVEQLACGASAGLTAFAAQMVAESRLTAGDHEGCLALVDVTSGPPLTADPWSMVGWCELLTRAELAAGRPDAAASWAARAEVAAARLGLAGRTGLALLARAQVQAARAQADGPELALAARDALYAADMVLDALRARVVAGRALAARGDIDLAAAELKCAYTGFDACGARLLARRALSERHRLSATASRGNKTTRRDGLAWLSRREAQIASLVAEGLTNRRIAQRLFVTEKTIEMHMSNIFIKLGVPSRAAVASAVIRADTAAQISRPLADESGIG